MGSDLRKTDPEKYNELISRIGRRGIADAIAYYRFFRRLSVASMATCVLLAAIPSIGPAALLGVPVSGFFLFIANTALNRLQQVEEDMEELGIGDEKPD